MSHDLNRRGFLVAATTGATLVNGMARAQEQAAPARKAPVQTAKPLPFDPQKINGLSEKILRSHYDNNYIGAVNA